MRPTDAALRAQHDAAQDLVMEGRTDVPGMTYEEGVAAALAWVLGHTSDEPMEDGD